MATGGVAKRRSCGAALARLAGEAQEALKKPNDGIWSKPVCDDDLMKIQFPEEYPSCAPHVTFLTTGGGKTRFNPNLYADGKVCLSILGTWRGESGEQWSSVQNCQSLMVSIQSLMDDMPYHNEPGFEKESWEHTSRSRGGSVTTAAKLAEVTAKYNLKITHETLRIAVCDVLEDILKVDPERIHKFSDIVKWHFLLYFDRYIEIVRANADVTGPFETTEFEYARNSMVGTFDFRSLEERLLKIKELLMEELALWISKGELATTKGVHSYDCQQIQMALQRMERAEMAGISASPQASNLFVWDVTIIGGLDGSWWENGIYTLRLYFPPDFPDVHPRPKFETKMFHPNISIDGFPFLSLSIADSRTAHQVIQDLHALLRNPPNPDPRTWVNREAGELYFNQGEKGREEYARRVRRCAARSMED